MSSQLWKGTLQHCLASCQVKAGVEAFHQASADNTLKGGEADTVSLLALWPVLACGQSVVLFPLGHCDVLAASPSLKLTWPKSQHITTKDKESQECTC